jgi:hypothetical protein
VTSIYSRVIVTADGTCVLPGIDFEGRRVRVHHRDRTHLVLHVSGGTGWGGVGMRAYAPAKFLVLRILAVSRTPASYLGSTGEELRTADVVFFDVTAR